MYRHVSDIAERVGTCYGQAPGSWVYKVCLEYCVHKSQDGMESSVSKFNRFERS